MSRVTTTMQRLSAAILTAGVLFAPAVALAGGGHHGHQGHRSHHARGHRAHHGRSGLGIHIGHRDHYSGHHARDRHYRQYHRYPSYRYRYRAPYYRSGGTESVYRADTATARAADQAGVDRQVRTPHRTERATSTAWHLLAQDRPRDALAEFSRRARSDPDNGMPKVGYALASALSGDLTKGVWAMRRALRADPQSLSYVTIDDELRPKLEQLVHQYQQPPADSTQHPDAAFMRASLHYLLRDTNTAHQAIARALHAGDSSASATNLKQLIEEDTASGATHASGSDRALIGQLANDAATTGTGHDY